MKKIKIKTRRAVKKRFRLTKSGKIKMSGAFRGHLLSGKSRKRKRSSKKAHYVSKGDAKRLKKLMPYG